MYYLELVLTPIFIIKKGNVYTGGPELVLKFFFINLHGKCNLNLLKDIFFLSYVRYELF